VFAREHDLKEYVKWRIVQSITNTAKNFHMGRSMPPRPNPNKPYTKRDFESVCDFLKSVEMLGFVDRFGESMVLFEGFLEQYFPEINLAYIPKNVNQEFKTIEQRLAGLKDQVGADLYDAFVNCNKNDLALFEVAKAHFEKQIESFPGFESKLKIFRDRCSALKNTRKP